MNSKYRVYVTRKIPEPGLSMISRQCQIILNKKDTPPSRHEIIENVEGKDAILCMLSDKIDSKVIEAAGRNLKVISTYSTGLDHIDVEEATKRGVYVTFTGDILSETTADLTFALILAAARKIAIADRYVRKGRWKSGWSPELMLGHNVHGMTLGIIGMGRIGTAVAKRAKGFEMNILYHSRKRNLEAESQTGAKFVDLDMLFQSSDFITIHSSLNDGSVGMLNESKFKTMKRNAFVINTARGQIINEKDLVKALKQGWIAGAGLDVFEKEPIPTSSPLLKMENVTLLPHIGSASYQTRSNMARIAAENLLNVLNNKDPIYLVNPEVKRVRPL